MTIPYLSVVQLCLESAECFKPIFGRPRLIGGRDSYYMQKRRRPCSGLSSLKWSGFFLLCVKIGVFDIITDFLWQRICEQNMGVYMIR